MIIEGKDGFPIPGICTFPYKGWTIAASTVKEPQGIIWVFNSKDGDTPHQFPNVQKAIEWIDAAAEHRDQHLIHPGADESFADQCEAEGSLMP